MLLQRGKPNGKNGNGHGGSGDPGKTGYQSGSAGSTGDNGGGTGGGTGGDDTTIPTFTLPDFSGFTFEPLNLDLDVSPFRGNLDVTEVDLKDVVQAPPVPPSVRPSIPAISNVGAVPFTGVVDWASISGGFQPLPQVAGGRKKLYQLSQFHGGINQKSSPRDISDQECQEATNVTVSQVGRMKLLGDCLNTNAIGADISADSIQANFPGYGLFQFTAPADFDGGTTSEHVFTCVADGDEVSIYEGTNAIDADWISGLGTTDDTTVCQVYYASGNGLYVADANFAHENASKAKIYVSRQDINATVAVSGWIQGNPLINSPTYDDAAASGMAAGDVKVNNVAEAVSVASTMIVECDPTGSAGDGTWDGDYYFYVSWLFDGGCETGLTSAGDDDGTDQASDVIAFADGLTLNFNVSLSHAASGSAQLGGDKRIEGARVYFKESGTTERFLLAEISLVDGVRSVLDSTFVPWSTGAAPVFTLASDIVFTNPPELYTYLDLNGYYANEVYTKSPDINADNDAGPTPIPVRYKTAVVGQQGVVFIGNVKFDKRHIPDGMMFSIPGGNDTPAKPGVFPKYNFFDSPSSDGSPITALAAFQDKILQFKQNAMYVINISNGPGSFYAEASFRDCGVANPCQVFTTAFGVIFANKFGCFIYDGRKVISLTNGKFDWLNQSGVSESTSNATDANVPCVGYDPRSQSIIILKNIGDDAAQENDTTFGAGAWVYNLLTQSWTEGDDMITNANGNRHTNFIITNDGYLAIKRDDDGTLLNYNHDKSVDTGAQTITYQTKDMDFGLPSQTKKLFKIYISYKGTPPSTINYRTDGSTTEYGFTETNWAAAGTNDYEIATLVPDDAAEGKDWYSISLYMNGSTAADFEINDIAILYRSRPIK
jgi:hypothetical protein